MLIFKLEEFESFVTKIKVKIKESFAWLTII